MTPDHELARYRDCTQVHIHAVAIKPGKPLTVGTFSRSLSPLYFGLPGNPAAAFVTFWRFVQPAIKKLSGLAEGWEPKLIKARSRHELRADSKRETYLWGQTFLNREGTYEFQPASGSHSSGNLINLAQTNSLAILPIGQTLIPAGEHVLIIHTAHCK